MKLANQVGGQERLFRTRHGPNAAGMNRRPLVPRWWYALPLLKVLWR